jgi:5-methylphenazine-1-carboxylate 1-monooxygenase
MRIAIIGGGVGGLTLALALHARGIEVEVVEAAPEIRPLGVGINILPHATKELAALGVLDALEAVSIATKEAAYFNRFGQLILTEPLGRAAGYPTPQLSIHRGDLQMVLLAAVRERLGPDAVRTGLRCVGVDTEAGIARLVHTTTGDAAPDLRADAIIASDGIRWCAGSSSPMRGRRSIPASTCGAARRACSRSCPAPPWSGPAGSRRARW